MEVGKVYTSTFGTAAVHERLLRLPEFVAQRDTDPHSTRMGEPSNDNDTMLLGGQPAALAVALQGFERLEVAAASARAVADGLLRRDVGALGEEVTVWVVPRGLEHQFLWGRLGLDRWPLSNPDHHSYQGVLGPQKAMLKATNWWREVDCEPPLSVHKCWGATKELFYFAYVAPFTSQELKGRFVSPPAGAPRAPPPGVGHAARRRRDERRAHLRRRRLPEFRSAA